MAQPQPDPEAEIWREVEVRLSAPYGQAGFATADGHLVVAAVVQDGMRLIVRIYVDGIWDPKWCKAERSEAALPPLPRRFMPTRSKYVYAAEARTKAGRRIAKRQGVDVDARVWQTGLHWTDGGKCVRHLRRHNPGIRVLSVDEYKALDEQRRAAACR